MTHRFPHLRAALMSQVWAMKEDWLLAMAEVVENRAAGIRLSPDEVARRADEHSQIAISASIGNETLVNGTAALFEVDASGTIVAARSDRVESEAPVASMIAVITITGVIAQHARQVDDISGPGGTSTERVSRSFRAAMDDPSVKAIVFNVDSPGGNVHGVQELFEEIVSARGRKPIIAQVNSTAASAAYWLVTAADEIVATPGGEVGSIGVYGMHRDLSGKAERDGMKITFISAGPYKVEGHPFDAPSEEFLAYQQGEVEKVYGKFISDVARGRGVSAETVKASFGQGRMKLAKDAKAAGMVDSIATMDETLRRVARMKTSPKGARAELVAANAAEEIGAPAIETAAMTPTGILVVEDQVDPDEFRRRRHAHRVRCQ